MKTVVVGDVHGCHDEAVELLGKIGIDSGDRVIFAGDLVDRGPKPRECVELAMEYEAILGNHEEKHLRKRSKPDHHHPASHAETLATLTNKHYEYLDTLPLWLDLPEYNALVVHAGVIPEVPIEEQKHHFLLHGQHILSPADRGRDEWKPTQQTWWPSKAPANAKFWAEFYKGPKRVIFGHTVFERPLETTHALGIDTGCVFGGKLTAVVLPTWELVSVNARKEYYPAREKSFSILGTLCFS